MQDGKNSKEANFRRKKKLQEIYYAYKEDEKRKEPPAGSVMVGNVSDIRGQPSQVIAPCLKLHQTNVSISFKLIIKLPEEICTKNRKQKQIRCTSTKHRHADYYHRGRRASFGCHWGRSAWVCCKVCVSKSAPASYIFMIQACQQSEAETCWTVPSFLFSWFLWNVGWLLKFYWMDKVSSFLKK